MSVIDLDAKNGMLEINLYNGNSMRREVSQLESHLERPFFSHRWNFFRQENNHAYVRGDVFYEGDCKNNVIISPYLNNRLVNVQNAFVFVGDLFIEVSPISDISNAIDKGKRKLFNQEIDYHIPTSVFKRENLIGKDLERLKGDVREIYGIEPEKISVIDSGRTKNGIYYIRAEDGKEYVLKFKGRYKEKAELLSQIAENIPIYFPLNFRRKDSPSFTFEIGGELYGLEEFIRKISPKIRDAVYFSLLGTHIGLLHRQFLNFIENNGGCKELLVSMGEHTSKSNFVSLYLDLSRDELGHKLLLPELERIIEERLDDQMNSFPRRLIHRDLNHSNLIWEGDNFKIVDSETLKISNRLNEFESPLLFGGNMEKPKYIRNSLSTMIHSYNQSSEMPLSKEEMKVLPSLLRYSLLKNFVVRKIRRGLKDETYIDKVKRNLKIIEEDLR